MAAVVLIDSGPIVAALSSRDLHHAWARSHLQRLTTPCLSCEAVLSESFFLLEGKGKARSALCTLLEDGIITTDSSLDRHWVEIMDLIRRYTDIQMSFADACLVRMAEIHQDSIIFTTDSDFNTYRKNRRQMIPLLAPW